MTRMEFDIEAMLQETNSNVGALGARCTFLMGQLAALKKHSDKQAEELAELRKAHGTDTKADH